MQALQVFRAARIEALVDKLVEALRAPQSTVEDVLRPVQIAVGNRGMERWLRGALAERLQIATNLAFPFPRQAILQLLQIPEAADACWHRDALTWTVLQVLPSLRRHPAVAPVVAWLAQQLGRSQQLPQSGGFDWPETVQPQEAALAAEIAGVLDKVAVYRPELLERWSSEVPQESADEVWQRVVWHHVQAELRRADAEALHPSLRLHTATAPQANGTLHIFAVSNLPAVWLGALQRAVHAGQNAQVVLYVLTPADGYWGDYQLRRSRTTSLAELQAQELVVAQQHPLLTSLGKVARDHVQLLTSVCDDSEPAGTEAFAFAAQGALGQIQRDLVALKPLEALHEQRPTTPVQPGDLSLQFHACHGPSRQVEALREALFGLLQADPTLQFRDMVVMTPDVATYAPLVETIFAEGYRGPHKLRADAEPDATVWGEFGGPRIRTHIADLGLRQLNPLADALLRMLELATGRLTASALADLLAVRAVMSRFDLDDDAVATIRTWLNEAGARLGEDAADRESMGLPRQHTYTLAFALERLALGVAVADPGLGLFAGVAPYDEMEGDARRLYGAFADFCAVVLGWRRNLRAPRSVAQWVEAAKTLVSELTELPAKASFLRAELLGGLDELAAEAVACTRATALQAFAAMLQARFERPRSGERASGSAVTVCALTPMRSVPFRVVCLLGMDDGAFPRATTSRRFDLVAADPRPGDPDAREDDRNLFLEAVLSARDHLLVFFSGRDAKTDRPLAPAVPVGDLLDVVDATFCLPEDVVAAHPAAKPRDVLTWQHRVQPFSPGGFQRREQPRPNPQPLRFDARLRRVAGQLEAPRILPAGLLVPGDVLADPSPVEVLSLDELADWLLCPIRELVKQRAGVVWRDGDDSLADREPLSLSGLEGWIVSDRLLTAMTGPNPADEALLYDNLAARALLPPGTPGSVKFAERHAPVAHLCEALPAAESVAVQTLRVEADGVALRGAASTIGTQPLVWSVSNPTKPKLRLRMWLKLLAWSVMRGEPGTATLWGLSDGGPTRITLQAPHDAQDVLTGLVRIWRRARTEPLPLFEASSVAWATEFAKKSDLDRARAAAQKDWSEGDYTGGSPPESADPVLASVCAGGSPWEDGGVWGDLPAELARQVWLPVVQATIADGKGK